MKATILDTVTGEKMTVDGPRSWEWAENNWSCDCNRNPWGVDTGKPDGVCEGRERFLVVEAVMNDPEDYEYTMDELNEGYPEELRSRFLTAVGGTINQETKQTPLQVLANSLDINFLDKGVGRVSYRILESGLECVSMIFGGCTITLMKKPDDEHFHLATQEAGAFNNLSTLTKINWDQMRMRDDHWVTAGDSQPSVTLSVSQRSVVSIEKVGETDEGIPICSKDYHLEPTGFGQTK